MNAQVFDSFLAIVDDALALAKEAVDAAEHESPKVTLTKVANETYDKAAKALLATGVFPGKSAADLSKSLRDGGESHHISLMEKLASSAVFTLEDASVFDGDLVEKSATSKTYHQLEDKTAVWQRAFDEADEELS